jgi:hypothetical protein
MSEDIMRYSLLAYVLCTRNLSKVRLLYSRVHSTCALYQEPQKSEIIVLWSTFLCTLFLKSEQGETILQY